MTASTLRPTVQVPVPGTGRATARPTRSVMDVSELPDTVFGARDIMWWGTLGFMVIEGFTLAICAVSYIYLGQNFQSWPPQGTRLPDLLVPTVQVAVMLVSLLVVRWISSSAHAFDLGKVRLGLVVLSLFGVAIAALRTVELIGSLNVKWDANAYGSAQWLVVGSHATLIAVELVEVIGMALIFWIAPVEKKHFSDAADIGFYWYFMVLAWIPLYVLCFLGPHWF